jgi:hypothetical protein
MKRKWGLQFAYQIIPSSMRPASSEPIFDRWFKMALPYLNQISASPSGPKAIRQLFEHKFKTWNTKEKLKGRNRFEYIQEIDLQNLAKDLNGPSDSKGSSIQPQGAQAQGRAPETGQCGAQANRGPAIPPVNVQITESHRAAPQLAASILGSNPGPQAKVGGAMLGRDTGAVSWLTPQAHRQGPGGGVMVPPEHRRRHHQEPSQPEQNAGAAQRDVSPQSDFIGDLFGRPVRPSARAESVRSVSRDLFGSRDASPHPHLFDTPVHRSGHAERAQHESRSHRFEPYGRPGARFFRAPRRGPISRRGDEDETEDMPVGEVTLLGRTKYIPVRFPRYWRADLMDREAELAEVKRQYHDRGLEHAQEGRNKRMLQGTVLQLEYPKRLEEMLEEADGADEGDEDMDR